MLREYAHRIMFERRCRLFLPGRVPKGCSLAIDLSRLFESRERQLKVVLDVGANIGQTARSFANVFPDASIHSFEPVPETFGLLRRNVCSLKNVTTHNFAIGATSGTVLMEIMEQSAWNRVAEPGVERSGRQVEKCEIRTLQDVSEALKLSGVDLLKIDVEGHELNVLAGARELFERGEILSVYAEVDFVEQGRHGGFFRLHDFLSRQDFCVYAFYDYSAWESSATESFCNCLWVHSSLWRQS